MQSLIRNVSKSLAGAGPPAKRGLRRTLLMLSLGLWIPSFGAGQQPGSGKPRALPYEALFPTAGAMGSTIPSETPQTSMVRIRESEPNNTAAQANTVSIGDVVDGVVSPTGDRDHVAFQVTAGTTVMLSVAASVLGSSLDPTLTLYGPTGTAVSFNDDFNGLDSRITYTAGTSGRYVAMVMDYSGRGGQSYVYELSLETLAPGPGDPTTLFATGFEAPWAMAAAGDGSVIVISRGSGVVRRVTAEGARVDVASGLQGPLGAALDGHGQLLVVEGGRQRVARIDLATGAISVFAEGLRGPVAITVGPDAAVWVSDLATQQLFRFDPEGRRERTIPLGSIQAISLAFSPSGTLYVAGYSGVFRLEGSALVRIPTIGNVETVAFDRDGYLYTVSGQDGVVTLYDTSFQRVRTVARTNISGPSGIAFLRDPQGRMTTRLVISNAEGARLEPQFRNGIVELNPAGVREMVGHRIGVDFLRLAGSASLPRATLGAPYTLQLNLTESMSEPTSWALASGELPRGVRLNTATGAIEGTPEEAGSWTFRVRVEAAARFGTADLRLEVHRPVVAATRASSQLLGVADALTADEQRFLDLVGNKNGRFDLGDFLLFINDQGEGSTPGAEAHRAPRADLTPAIRRVP